MIAIAFRGVNNSAVLAQPNNENVVNPRLSVVGGSHVKINVAELIGCGPAADVAHRGVDEYIRADTRFLHMQPGAVIKIVQMSPPGPVFYTATDAEICHRT